MDRRVRRCVGAFGGLVLIVTLVFAGALVVRERDGGPDIEPRDRRIRGDTGDEPERVRSCTASRVRGDFDGNGVRDVAIVSSKQRICRTDRDSSSWTIAVDLGKVGHVERSLFEDLGPPNPEVALGCSPWCRAVAAPDLDGDGRAELAISAGSGAYTEQIVIYRVGREQILPIRLAGAIRNRRPRLAVFMEGASVAYGSALLCRARRDAKAVVVQASWGNNIDARHRSSVGEEIFAFDGRRFELLTRREYLTPATRGYPPRIPGRRCLANRGL